MVGQQPLRQSHCSQTNRAAWQVHWRTSRVNMVRIILQRLTLLALSQCRILRWSSLSSSVPAYEHCKMFLVPFWRFCSFPPSLSNPTRFPVLFRHFLDSLMHFVGTVLPFHNSPSRSLIYPVSCVARIAQWQSEWANPCWVLWWRLLSLMQSQLVHTPCLRFLGHRGWSINASLPICSDQPFFQFFFPAIFGLFSRNRTRFQLFSQIQTLSIDAFPGSVGPNYPVFGEIGRLPPKFLRSDNFRTTLSDLRFRVEETSDLTKKGKTPKKTNTLLSQKSEKKRGKIPGNSGPTPVAHGSSACRAPKAESS